MNEEPHLYLGSWREFTNAIHFFKLLGFRLPGSHQMSDKCSLKRTNPTSTPDMKLLENQIPFQRSLPKLSFSLFKKMNVSVHSVLVFCFFFSVKKENLFLGVHKFTWSSCDPHVFQNAPKISQGDSGFFKPRGSGQLFLWLKSS